MKYTRQNFSKERKTGKQIHRLCVTITEDEREWLNRMAFCKGTSMTAVLLESFRREKNGTKDLTGKDSMIR